MKTSIVTFGIKLFLVVLTFLNTFCASSQTWSRLDALPGTEFTCIKVFSGTVYALSENKLYTSIDGNSWQEETITSDVITPISLEIFNNTLYIGTFSNGVYEKSLLPNSIWIHYLNGVAISSFVVHLNEIYLSTFGVGVYKRVANNWQNSNYNLPTFSYNVSKLLSINNTLYAFAGGNGTYYTFNPTTQNWSFFYFYGNLMPGFITDDAIITENNTVYVTRGNTLLRSNNLAQTWNSDAIGLINGNNRIIYEGVHSIYVVTLSFNDNEGLNYTRIQKRASNLPIASSWSTANELLEFYTYGICEFGNQVFLATEFGIYKKTDTSLGIETPSISEVKVFPIPSNTNEIHFSSDTPIDEVTIYDMQGRLVYKNQFNEKNGTITLSQKGVFVATFSNANEVKWSTKISIN